MGRVARTALRARSAYRERVKIISTTAGMIKTTPSRTFSVNGSLNTSEPTITAVSGSNAPSTATMVDPIRFTAPTTHRFVTTVHTHASANKWPACETAEPAQERFNQIISDYVERDTRNRQMD